MSRMTRYRQLPMKARAERQFGNVYVDVLIPPMGLDVDALIQWCLKYSGTEWETWAHAPHSEIADRNRLDYSRYFFAKSEEARQFKNAWKNQYVVRSSSALD